MVSNQRLRGEPTKGEQVKLLALILLTALALMVGACGTDTTGPQVEDPPPDTLETVDIYYTVKNLDSEEHVIHMYYWNPEQDKEDGHSETLGAALTWRSDSLAWDLTDSLYIDVCSGDSGFDLLLALSVDGECVVRDTVTIEEPNVYYGISYQ